MSRRVFFSVGVAIASIVLVALLQRPLASLENEVTILRYQLRGPQPVDTNVVLVYLDNEAIASLGWPIRRNFHALMVNALAELKAKVIGYEVMFESPNQEYPEYDHLLAGVVRAAGNVVLTSYFDSISRLPNASPVKQSAHPAFTYPLVQHIEWSGRVPHLPFTPLGDAAAGIGHANITDENSIPIFIGTGEWRVPSFGVEVLRQYTGAPREAVMATKGEVVIPGAQAVVTFPVSDQIPLLNLPASLSAFTTYPFLEVLKSFDAQQSGRSPLIPLGRLKGKIVLVGVIAEGRSTVVSTLLHPRVPSLVFQAVFIDNALRGAFLTRPPQWLMYMAIGLLAFGVVMAILLMKLPRNVLLVSVTLSIIVAGSFVLFLWSGYLLPLVPLLLVALGGTISAMVYKHRFVQAQIESLQAEKELITARLRDREAKVAMLEGELLDFEANRPTDRTNELLGELRKYKEEIRELTSKADDMEVYSATGDEDEGAVVEFEGIVYRQPGKMKSIVDFVEKIAGNDAPVLILGESGTGKELVAKAIHRRSPRVTAPFIAVNCGALAENLLESELFGHEKGAFTGAVKEKQGRFELAHTGTIFLDEIGEVSELFQLKLLRVLQEGEFERVGGTKTLRVDVRVVAATNKDLREMVKAGKFREDLYYRLNVLMIELPPLRERQEDIPLLITHFLKREGGGIRLSRNVMESLCIYRWPGNIRELESAIKRAVLLARSEKRTMITTKDLAGEIASVGQGRVAIDEQVLESIREKQFSRSAITETAVELGGLNRGTVAEYLRGQFLKALVEHGFDIEQTIRYLSFSADSEVNERVRKRLHEYLINITEVIDTSRPWEAVRGALKPKSKNLPQRYHPYLEQVGEAHFRGLWKLPPDQG